MPIPDLAPGQPPPFIPATANRATFGTGVSSGVVGQYVREIVGVNIAFKSPALTDAPLWIRLDDPGSI